jgi:pentose-5-phosphate-3-epimerase
LATATLPQSPTELRALSRLDRFGPNEAVRIESTAGSISDATVLRAAGADLFVAGTSVFHRPHRAVAYREPV